MGKFDKTRLAVSELESIKNNVRELNKIVVMLTIAIVILVIGGIIVVSNSVTIPDTESWPEAGPSAVFGVSQCPDADADATDAADASCRVCPTCPACACVHRSYTWLGRFTGALDEEAQSPEEIRDVLRLLYDESRYTPSAVSSAGAVGICQIKPDAWPDVDMALLVEDPDYAAVQCLRIYRIYRSKCGGKWYRCYRMGVAGARAATGGAR